MRVIHLSGIHLSSVCDFGLHSRGTVGSKASIEMLGSLVNERFEYISLGVGGISTKTSSGIVRLLVPGGISTWQGIVVDRFGVNLCFSLFSLNLTSF